MLNPCLMRKERVLFAEFSTIVLTSQIVKPNSQTEMIMKYFVSASLIAIAVFVFGNVQVCYAQGQIEIFDGDGKRVEPSVIAPQDVEVPPTNGVPKRKLQFPGGNGSTIIIRSSSSTVDENGEQKIEKSGQAIVIGPDGKRQEFDLTDEDVDIGGMKIRGLFPELQKGPKVANYSVGVKCKPIHPAVASQLNLEVGLMVAQVAPGSPAATAGIQKYDVLLFADDKQLETVTDLNKVLRTVGEADSSVSLTVVHGGKESSVTVKPEKVPAGTKHDLLMQGLGRFPRGLDLELPALQPDGLFEEFQLDRLPGGVLDESIEAQMLERMQQMQRQFRLR